MKQPPAVGRRSQHRDRDALLTSPSNCRKILVTARGLDQPLRFAEVLIIPFAGFNQSKSMSQIKSI